MHPLSDNDDARTRAPSGLCFPYMAYNMEAAADCRQEDIFDMLDPRTNKWPNDAKWLLHITLVLSRPS